MSEPREESFFAGGETVQVWLTPNVYVNLKRDLTFGEQGQIDNAMLNGIVQREKGGESQQVYEFNLSRQRLAKLAVYVDSWNLPGPNGQTVRLPAQFEARTAIMANLRSAWATKILAEIERLEREAGEVSAADLESEAADDPLSEGGNVLALQPR